MANQVVGKPMRIPLNKIRQNAVALRDVNRAHEDYLGLVDSIRKNGVLNSISVREIKDQSTGDVLYGLIDGLHRFSASRDAGMDDIPAMVFDKTDGEVLEAQIIANAQRIETKPVEYSKQLVLILSANPLMTVTELAGKLSKSVSWLNDRLGLTKLDPKIGELVDRDEMNLMNAYALAKLPVEEQLNFLDRAQTMQPQEFVPTVQARIKQIKEDKRKGKDSQPEQFVPVAHVRKPGELKEELEQGVIGKTLITELKITSPEEGFKLGLQWALHLDPSSVEKAKQEDEARKKATKEAREKREKEAAEKKMKEAAATKARLEEEAKKLYEASLHTANPEALVGAGAGTEAAPTPPKA